MQHSQGRNNGESIFGIKKLPTDNHIRKVLDHVPAEKLFPVFFDIFDELLKVGELSNYRFLGDQLLIAIDGTGHFSSDKLHCKNCSTIQHKTGKTTYFHNTLFA